MKPTTPVSALVLVLLTAAPATAEENHVFVCWPEKAFICSTADGCKPAPMKVNIRISNFTNEYTRYDTVVSRKYKAVMDISGNYLNISVPGKSLLAKVDLVSENENYRKNFIEVVSLGMVTMTYFGKCIGS